MTLSKGNFEPIKEEVTLKSFKNETDQNQRQTEPRQDDHCKVE